MTSRWKADARRWTRPLVAGLLFAGLVLWDGSTGVGTAAAAVKKGNGTSGPGKKNRSQRHQPDVPVKKSGRQRGDKGTRDGKNLRSHRPPNSMHQSVIASARGELATSRGPSLADKVALIQARYFGRPSQRNRMTPQLGVVLERSGRPITFSEKGRHSADGQPGRVSLIAVDSAGLSLVHLSPVDGSAEREPLSQERWEHLIAELEPQGLTEQALATTLSMSIDHLHRSESVTLELSRWVYYGQRSAMPERVRTELAPMKRLAD